MTYFIVGVIAFIVGSFIGIVIAAMCAASKTSNMDYRNDICYGCFGAANNDCEECTRKGNRKDESNKEQ